MKGLSLSAYARHRGCRLSSVQEAVRSGRLRKSLTKDGKIRDAEAADAEWEATTHAEMRPGRAAEPDLAEVRLRHELARACAAELELAKMRGEVVLAADVESRLVDVFAACKTKLLAVPARARQQDPGLTSSQLGLFEELIREALSDLAGAEEAS